MKNQFIKTTSLMVLLFSAFVSINELYSTTGSYIAFEGPYQGY
ncbi:hypothetical protein [Polaribacter atrinae]